MFNCSQISIFEIVRGRVFLSFNSLILILYMKFFFIFSLMFFVVNFYYQNIELFLLLTLSFIKSLSYVRYINVSRGTNTGMHNRE